MRTGVLAPLVLIMAMVPCLVRADDAVKAIALPARFLLWDPGFHRIYATVPASAPNAGGYANTLAIIEPETGAVISTAFVGAEPGRMALSASGRYLYIAVDGANSLRVYDVLKQTMSPLIPLGPGLTVADLAAVPGFPDSIAVERQNRYFSPSDNGAMIFDADGTSRRNVLKAGHSLVYEPLTDRMYGYENEISSYGIQTMTADRNGLVQQGYIERVIALNTLLVAGQNGLLFTDSATVIDPMTWTKVGQFPGYSAHSILAVDSPTGRVYFARRQPTGVEISAFDTTTFAPVASTPIPMPRGNANQVQHWNREEHLIRWGDYGLAFTAPGQVWLIKSTVVGPKRRTVDIAVVAVDLPARFPAGSAITSTVTVTNVGRTPATGVVLSNRLSPNIEIVSVAASYGTAASANGVAHLNVGDLPPGAKVTLTLQIRLKPQAGNEAHPLTTVTQTVVARANELDSSPANNHVTQTTELATSREQNQNRP